MKTTVLTRIFIAALCALGIYQIFQFLKPTTSNSSAKEEKTEKTSLSTAKTTENDGEDDPALDNLPVAAKNYVKEKFALEPNQAEWKKQSFGYEAIFQQNGRTYEVEFDPQGNWVETELENVPSVEVPSVIIDAAKKLYPTGRITEFEIELTPKGTFYELEMTTEKGETEVYFDSNGQRAKNLNEDK